jgi:DNA-binding FadR family transcriptional regulator
VQQAIRQYIIDNELRAGDPLPSENQLSQQLGVSRNLVRESVRGLEALGVVDIRRGSGLYVNQFSFEPLIDNLQYGLLFDLRELLEMVEIRHVLETSLIGKAMAKMSTVDIRRLEDILSLMDQARKDDLAYIEADRQFHQALLASLDNKTLLKVLDAFWLTFNKASEIQEIAHSDPDETYEVHSQIVNAVASGDAERARKALDQHYAAVESRWVHFRSESLHSETRVQ